MIRLDYLRNSLFADFVAIARLIKINQILLILKIIFTIINKILPGVSA
jgi:hypothetical protein